MTKHFTIAEDTFLGPNGAQLHATLRILLSITRAAIIWWLLTFERALSIHPVRL